MHLAVVWILEWPIKIDTDFISYPFLMSLVAR